MERVSKNYYYIIRGRIQASSYVRCVGCLNNHIRPSYLSGKKIGKIRPDELQILINNLAESGLALSSVKKVYNILGEFFRYEAALGDIARNPMLLVKLPKAINCKPVKEMSVLTAEEVKKVISVAEETIEGEPTYRYGEAIILLLLTGIRAGELRGIRPEDIDWQNKILHINRGICIAPKEEGGIEYFAGKGKTKNALRDVPLCERAMLSLERLKQTTYVPESGYLICGMKTGEPVDYNGLQKCYDMILKASGIKHMGLHSTRHTFATLMLKDAKEKGMIKEVSELLGHSEVSTTYKYYIKTSNEDKRSMITGLEEVLI